MKNKVVIADVGLGEKISLSHAVPCAPHLKVTKGNVDISHCCQRKCWLPRRLNSKKTSNVVRNVLNHVGSYHVEEVSDKRYHVGILHVEVS